MTDKIRFQKCLAQLWSRLVLGSLVPAQCDANEDDADAEGKLHGDGFAEYPDAENDSDDRQQIGDGGRQDGSVVGDDAVVEDIGDSGADRPKTTINCRWLR